jgi:catechol 2,3-dioxygenase-like lactoylglutathione lyase family enzyme
MTANEFLRAKNEEGKPLDRQVRFYTSVPGLKAVKALPDYFNDPDSLNYGVLLRWRNPLFGLPAPKFWAAIFPLLFRLEGLYLKFSK